MFVPTADGWRQPRPGVFIADHARAAKAYEDVAALGLRRPQCTIDPECLHPDGHPGLCYVDEYV